MNLTKEEKARFTDVFNEFQHKTDTTEKQSVISELSKEDLEKFTFHLYNEAYKYSEDLKSDKVVPADRLRVTKEQLKEISPYLVTAKIKYIYNELGDNLTEEQIKEKVRSEFKIQNEEVDDKKLDDLAKALKNIKVPSLLEDPGALMPLPLPTNYAPQLEDPGFWETYFMWLIHLFVEKTARELRNEKEKLDKTKEYNTAVEGVEAENRIHQKKIEAFKAGKQAYDQDLAKQLNDQKISSEFSQVDLKSREEKLEIEVLKKHLIKQEDQLQAPTQVVANKDGIAKSIHDVKTMKKQDKAATWFKKDNFNYKARKIQDPATKYAAIQDLQKREVIAAEFLRFFIPETPKYRIIDDKTQVISKKVGLNRENRNYADDIKTFQAYGKNNIENIKRKFQNDKELAKQYYKIQIASALIGSYDSHLSNVMYSKNQHGKETLYPIDFGGSCLNMEEFFKEDFGQSAERTIYYIVTFKDGNADAFKDAMYEVSKVWFEKEKEIKEHLKNSCKALSVPDAEYNKLTKVIDANKNFISQIREIINIRTQNVQSRYFVTNNKRTLPQLIMGKTQLRAYEGQNKPGQGAAPRI